MKKFISMVMAAAMVVSLVPATAFAAEITTKVVDAVEWTEQEAKDLKDSKADLVIDGAQLQLKVKDADSNFGVQDDYDIKLAFDNAEFITGGDTAFDVSIYSKDDNKVYPINEVEYDYDAEDDDVTITIYENKDAKTKEVDDIQEGDIIYIDFKGDLKLTSYKVGAEATVAVKGDLGTADAKVIAAVVAAGIDASVEDTVDVAEEEIVALDDEGLTIEVNAGDDFSEVLDFRYNREGERVEGKEEAYAKIVLKVSKGFEFACSEDDVVVENADGTKTFNPVVDVEEDEITLYVGGKVAEVDEIVIYGLEIEATSAKEGDVATIKVSSPDVDSVEVEVANVVAEGLAISVDEDEDVPEMWAGVDANNTGLTVDDSHESLEITLEETVKGAYSDKDEVEFKLPEGVYVVAVEDDGDVVAGEEDTIADVLAAAYEEGDNESFVIKKRVLSETEDAAKAIDTEFTLTLIAEAWFAGDVVLEMLVDGESVGEVTIATFKAPFAIEAAQNDLIIDYRYTEVPTDVVIKEAEAGLWDKGLEFELALDHEIEFEKDPVVTVNEDDSDMEVDVDVTDGTIEVVVDKESDDEAAVVTISDMSLYMGRSLAAGAYDLEATVNAAAEFYMSTLWTTEADEDTFCAAKYTFEGKDIKPAGYTVADVNGYVDKNDHLDAPKMVVKEGFVNVVTAGRDADDASFTTKVVVPVGEMYLVAGEETVALDVPAYVSAAGYTMLPVRAVAVALGILNNNVLWDQATKTVTILYGQRIITMQVGAKVVYVNGSAIPASASPEVVDGRTFLPMRDLATALGVTDITWDAATKTATMNGNK